MAKHDRRKTSGQPPSSRPVTIQVPLPVLGVVNGVREAFHGFCIATGLQVLEAMMEADREVLCGAKGRHQVERPAWRGGSVDSQVTLGGRQVELPRLRVRSSDGEVPLASFQWAAATDPLDEHTLAAVAAGVSTRRYAGTLDPVPADVTERATSSSAVSRRFVALSTKRLQAFLSRPLGELDLRAVCIDGKVFRDHCMVIALGIDTQGRKHVLGLREGATETAAVTTGLLSDLVTRGLPTDRTLLFVIDGATGLRRAITDVFGSRGVVQRCQVHKWRNVIGHLPERLHASVGKALRDAWNLDSADHAARVLKRLAGSLEHDHPGAKSRGVNPGGTGRDADRAAPRSDGGAAAYAADDEHHREPERQRRALLAQRQALAWWPDDSTLGGERAGGGGEALPAGPGLPRSAAPGRCPGRAGSARRRGC